MSGWGDLSSKLNLPRRRLVARVCHALFALATWAGVALLLILLVAVTQQGIQWLSPQFFTHFPSRFPEQAGIKSALWGTVWLVGLTALISVTVGGRAALCVAGR